MRKYYMYLKYVFIHKWYVFLECRRLKVSLWQSIIHDWDKFLPSNIVGYTKTFRKEDGTRKTFTETDFTKKLFQAHYHKNPHHWQHWARVRPNGSVECLEMPEKYVREMVADWIGAGYAHGQPDYIKWYKANTHANHIQLHPNTRKLVEILLNE